LNSAQAPDDILHWTVGESFFRPTGYDFVTPSLALSYDLKEDLSGVTLHLRQGVQFDKGWGEMTAEDAVWSLNDANANVTPTSIHGQAGDFASLFGEAEMIDKYTMYIPFMMFDARWVSNYLNHSAQSLSIMSKKAYDENGEEWMRENIVATGPFEALEWVRDDHATLVARDSHWRKVPEVDQVTFLEVPEMEGRRAMMLTGEVDGAWLTPVHMIDLREMGFVFMGAGLANAQGIFFCGNLWEDTHAVTGETLSRDPLLRDLPWIGNPISPNTADDPPGMDDMEQARLVRTALAISFDREMINETVMGGIGYPSHVWSFDPNHPRWRSEWEYPYDPEKAKELLTQAGYPNGFEMPLFIQTTAPVNYEIGDALSGFWSRIGVDTPVLKYAFTIFRPGLVGRTQTVPYLTQGDEGMITIPWDWPRGTTLTSLTRGGFSGGIESPKIAELFFKASNEPDPDKRMETNDELAEYYRYWTLHTSVVVVPMDYTINPKSLKSWGQHISVFNNINSLENMVPAPR